MTFQKQYIITVFFIILVILLGIFFTRLLWDNTVEKLSEEAIEQALIVARSIDSSGLQSLQGNSTDLHSPDYIRIKEQLTRIRLSHRTCLFLYLMGQREDGNVFFYLDSQLPESEDYAPPGLVYDEVSEEYLYTFDSGKQRTVGPITDRWGTLVTSLIPINNPDTNELIAVLGMDIDIKDWKNEINSQISLPISLTISIVLLLILLLILNRNRQIVQEQYNEKNKYAEELQQSIKHVKILQGLLPICALCKKIRDDKGYWNSIESYIEKHSNAQFTHGLCDDCIEKFYGEEK